MLHEVLEAAGPLQAELQTHMYRNNIKSSRIKLSCLFIQSGWQRFLDLKSVWQKLITLIITQLTGSDLSMWLVFGWTWITHSRFVISSVGALAEHTG